MPRKPREVWRPRVGPDGSLADLIVQRVGFVEGVKVHALLWAWALFIRENGRTPSLYELAGATPKKQTQWYRDAEAFGRAFPEEESPDRIARLIVAKLEGRPYPSTPFGLGSLPWAGSR